jgi:predicted CoA-binding protein
MRNKKTLVIGASLNPGRYSYKAVSLLSASGFPVYALGLRPGKIGEVQVVTTPLDYPDVHTVTLYINPKRQPGYYEYILSLSPERVIFNPGTENAEFERILHESGIAYIENCTLVMLSMGVY